MTEPVDNAWPDDTGGFDSRDCVNLVIDGPGDCTVRPIEPHLLKHAMAERERLIRWGGMIDPSSPNKPADQ